MQTELSASLCHFMYKLVRLLRFNLYIIVICVAAFILSVIIIVQYTEIMSNRSWKDIKSLIQINFVQLWMMEVQKFRDWRN